MLKSACPSSYSRVFNDMKELYLPDEPKESFELAREGSGAERSSEITDFQSFPLHINICSLSNDNNTQGTSSCR